MSWLLLCSLLLELVLEMTEVSISIPVYNFDKYLPSLFDNLLAQTYTDFQVFLSDDASTDSSLKVIKEYKKKFDLAGIKFKWTSNLNNLGARPNSKYVFGLATASDSKYILHLEGDDYVKPNYLETTVNYLNNNPEFAAVHSDVDYLENSGSGISRFWKEVSPYPVEHPTSWGFLCRDNRIFTCTFICKREIYAWAMNFDLFDQLNVHLGDYFCSLRVSKHHKIAYIDEPLAVYRHRSDSESHKISHAELVAHTNHVKYLAQNNIGLD